MYIVYNIFYFLSIAYLLVNILLFLVLKLSLPKLYNKLFILKIVINGDFCRKMKINLKIYLQVVENCM